MVQKQILLQVQKGFEKSYNRFLSQKAQSRSRPVLFQKSICGRVCSCHASCDAAQLFESRRRYAHAEIAAATGQLSPVSTSRNGD